MDFESQHVFHIYNQGNNRQKIFYSRENYLYFLRKVDAQIKPFADILAWCLMPNHFHLMVYVNRVERSLPPIIMKKSSTKDESIPTSGPKERIQSLSQSIGVMLGSYTRAINLQNKTSGSVFRSETKSICLTRIDKITRSWFMENGITRVNHVLPEKEYPNVCYNYILFNPLKDKIVRQNEDWDFCSYPDVMGLRQGKLISRERISELGLFLMDPMV